MNKQRILEAADKFAEMPDENPEVGLGFDMNYLLSPFQEGLIESAFETACCIAGWVQCWSGSKFIFGHEELAEHWEITVKIAHRVVFPGEEIASKARPRHAAALLYHFVETGEVDWPRAMGDDL